MLISEGFIQPAFKLPLAFSSNSGSTLRAILKQKLLPEEYAIVAIELEKFEVELIQIRQLSALTSEPTLVQYSHFGERIDELKTSEGWRELKKVTVREGFVAEGIERRFGARTRISSLAKASLFTPDGSYVGCPISMTDGAARLLELAGNEEMKSEILPRLISRDPAIAWTAGQWMTERPGGSDVSRTETFATLVGEEWILDGFKWFSSATDGDIALALAATAGGLSLFLIRLRDDAGHMNGIRIHRLKKKVGTKALPTAELELKNCRAELIGELGQGVKIISTILNITRVHSALSATSQLRRAIDIAVAFAQVRHVGGEKGSMLNLNPMHNANLAKLEVTYRAITHFTFGVIALLGRNECVLVQTEQEKHLLRLLTPVVKVFASSKTTESMPECMIALGGQGYMEENEIGRLIADSLVENIWEGTPNTLALDVVRVVVKSKGSAISAFIDWSTAILDSIPTSLDLRSATLIVENGLQLLKLATQTYLGPTRFDPRLPLPVLLLLGYLSSTLYLIQHTIWSQKSNQSELEMNRATVIRWSETGGFSDAMKVVQTILEGKKEARREIEMDSSLVYGKGEEAVKETVFVRSVL